MHFTPSDFRSSSETPSAYKRLGFKAMEYPMETTCETVHMTRSCANTSPSPADRAQSRKLTAGNSTDLMFRAFSDQTRLRILHVLLGGELCVGDVVEILRAPQPRISRHLAYLRKAGLVVVRKSGPWSHYSLASATTPFHQKLLECLENCFSEVPELKADKARAAKVRKSGGCCPRP